MIRTEFQNMLEIVNKQEHTGAIVVTCGVGRIWEKILQRTRLASSVKVIGGGRLSEELVVTPGVKVEVVDHLQNNYNMFCICFGDSTVDIPMLLQADKAVVVVGHVLSRSKTMEEDLRKAIIEEGLFTKQLVLPSSAPPRMDEVSLPLLKLTPGTIDDFTCVPIAHLACVHATKKKAAKLLQMPMRDSKLQGPALQEAHLRVGEYLATEFLSDVIGLEEIAILHVQGTITTGHQLLHEAQTVIVPLMCGGDPMARGVNKVFPLAMYKHANDPGDLQEAHLSGRSTVILVDSVINTGGSIVDFVKHIRTFNRSTRIVVVAGVVQQDAVSEGSPLDRANYRYGNLSVIALRQSANKYKGVGGTDTGNRLFNTTHMD